MIRKLLLVTLILPAALVLAHLHVQPAERARVIRSGSDLDTLKSRIGFGSRLGASSCLVPIRRGEILFEETLPLEAATGEPFGLRLRFAYQPPQKLSPSWPAGDWCSSLDSEVRRVASQWSGAISSDELRLDRRSASRKAAVAIEQGLEAQGLVISNSTSLVEPSPELVATQPVSTIVRASRPAPPVLFIGLDGADWQLLDGYIATGAMPNLAAMVREGFGGVLLTEHPPLSPLLWTTMMTGRSPLQHEILDFTRFHPETGVKEPITSTERKVPAIWNMATYGRKSAAVLGLWATYPAEPIRGLLVSDRLFTFLYHEKTPPPGIVFPSSRESWARETLQRAEAKIDLAAVREYLPWLNEAEYQEALKRDDPYAHPVSALRRILVETEVYHSLASDYLSKHSPDLTVLYFQGTDSIGHVFAPFAPPRQQSVSWEDYEKYHQVPERYFRYIDSLLGQYREVMRQKRGVMMLASDHGFRWSEGRPTQLSSFAAATAAKWHRNEGMYVLWGAGTEGHSGHTAKGGIQQVCATLLALIGLPPGERLAGPPLPGAPRAAAFPVDYARSYQPPRIVTTQPASNQEELSKLRALGYIGAGESLVASAAVKGTTRTAGSYNNQGLILKNQGKTDDAVTSFEKAISIDPNLASSLWNLSDILFEREQLDRSDELLVRAFSNGLPEGKKFLIGRAIGYQRSGIPQRSLQLVDRAVDSQPRDPELRMFRGRYRVELRQCAAALEDFRAVVEMTPSNPVPYASAGLAAMCAGDTRSAAVFFRKSLELNPNQPQLRAYLRSVG